MRVRVCAWYFRGREGREILGWGGEVGMETDERSRASVI
jgi:hypothetical protein